MSKSKKIRPVNSLVFVSDSAGGEVPAWIRDVQILSTPSCICVGCYPKQDGPTEIMLGNARELDAGGPAAFDGELETPSRRVVISSVEGITILDSTVPKPRTHVTIWVNHPRWPDRVIIGLD
jgi:hypothetical protein